MFNKRNTSIILILTVLIAFVLWRTNNSKSSLKKIDSSQEIAVENLLKNTKTQCIGRYLIDIPASFRVNRTPSYFVSNTWDADISGVYEYNKTYVATQRMYFPAFIQLIQRREKQLNETITVNSENMPFKKNKFVLTDGLEGVIFERNENESTDDAIRVLEAYFYNNGVAIKLQTQSINDSASRYETERGSDLPRNNVPRDIEKIKSLLARISGRNESEIPTKPGNCIPDAFIAENGIEKENISINLISDEVKNINLMISSDNFIREKNGVLDRVDEIAEIIKQSKGRIERKDSFKRHNLYAEELLVVGLQQSKDEPRYQFDLYINETTTSYENPNLILSLSNEGKPVPTYNKEELIAFWDSITRTIRLRK
ncbi:hypothetical protein GW579_23240 [Rahnella sp. Lac-M11]|jgi:hypothetical protein|uniref:Tle cognate immunity protein 4 C-terminal domain-containing protein n=1 Tax=Rahnella contaminans TaxID=2703882 RepID=A0A6M2BD03_9GAMM|nr:T6SS immunity protein Tli4 family protein [Rahnella contaminans]NGX89997.1 hypothetical protein [Rahnella contaminans]